MNGCDVEYDFFIYQRMGTEIILLGSPGMNGYPIYCYSMEFSHEDVLRDVKKFNCNAIPELLVNTLRAEAKQGQTDSAAVLAVQYGEKEHLVRVHVEHYYQSMTIMLNVHSY